MRPDAAIGWAESPLQALCIIEAHAAGRLRPHTRLYLRSDIDGIAAFHQSLSALALPAGLTLAPLDPPTEVHVPAWDGKTTVACGDPFSGAFQRAFIGRSLPARLLIVDDGAATIRFASLIASRLSRPLIRSKVATTTSRMALGLLTALRLRMLARQQRAELFTAFSFPPDDVSGMRRHGFRIRAHRFSWISQLPASQVRDPTIIIGSALAADGLIDAEAYRAWVLSHAGPVRYFPHRRETSEFLAQLRQAGIAVAASGMPVEVSLLGLGPGQRIVSLPTSALTTLRLLLHDSAVSFEPSAVPETWWTAAASSRFRTEINALIDYPAGRAPWHEPEVSPPRVIAIADSESYLKWGQAVLDRLPADWASELWLLDTPLLPSAAQVHAAIGARGRTIRRVHFAQLRAQLQAAGPDALILGATGPVVLHVSLIAHQLDQRPALFSGLPGVALPPTVKALRYRSLIDEFIVHSREEKDAWEALITASGSTVKVVLSRLPFLSERSHAPVADPVEQIVFAPQAKVPAQRAEREHLLCILGLAAAAGTDVIVKLRGLDSEQQTHHEQHRFSALAADLIAAGATGVDQLNVRTGAIADFLRPGSLLATVSSTAALEAIDRGLPVLIIDDFGVRDELINSGFAGSGLLGPGAELTQRPIRQRFARPEWLERNYFHSDVGDLAAALRTRTVGARSRSLRPPGNRLNGARLLLIRAQLRAAAPKQVVSVVRLSRRLRTRLGGTPRQSTDSHAPRNHGTHDSGGRGVRGSDGGAPGLQ